MYVMTLHNVFDDVYTFFPFNTAGEARGTNHLF